AGYPASAYDEDPACSCVTRAERTPRSLHRRCPLHRCNSPLACRSSDATAGENGQFDGSARTLGCAQTSKTGGFRTFVYPAASRTVSGSLSARVSCFRCASVPDLVSDEGRRRRTFPPLPRGRSFGAVSTPF